MSFFKILAVFSVLFIFVGCAAHSKCYYGDETRNMGMRKLGADISLNAGLGEYKDSLRERTIVKYEQLPVYGDAVNGYEGILYNDGAYRATFVIKGRYGIEVQKVSLDAGDYIYLKLLPDTYDYEIYSQDNRCGYYGGRYENANDNVRLTGFGVLHVGVKINPVTIRGVELDRHFYIISTYNGY
jgi:hypothetical protein